MFFFWSASWDWMFRFVLFCWNRIISQKYTQRASVMHYSIDSMWFTILRIRSRISPCTKSVSLFECFALETAVQSPDRSIAVFARLRWSKSNCYRPRWLFWMISDHVGECLLWKIPISAKSHRTVEQAIFPHFWKWECQKITQNCLFEQHFSIFLFIFYVFVKIF